MDLCKHVQPGAEKYATSKIIPVLERRDILALTNIKSSWSSKYEAFVCTLENYKAYKAKEEMLF